MSDALERLRKLRESCGFHEADCSASTIIACAEVLEEAADKTYLFSNDEAADRGTRILLREQATRLRSVVGK